MVDGVDFTDPALGLARARFSQDAISEFRVIANRFDPEIGGSAGGALSIVTKSGTNDLKGSAFGFFRDKSLKAQGALDLQKNDYSRQQWGGTLGGPLVKDRTHYFVSFEQINEDAIQLFRPGGAFTSQAADLPFPLNQSLVFGGARSPDQHRPEPARQVCLRTLPAAELPHRRRVRSVRRHESEPRQLERHGDACVDARRRRVEPTRRPGRASQVPGAEQLPGAGRVVLERQHPPDRREHRRRSERYRRHRRRCATRSSSTSGSGRWSQD